MILKTFLIAWLGVRTRPGRSVLTAVSLFVGVMAIVVIQAGAKAAQEAIVAQAVLVGGRSLTVSISAAAGSRSFTQAEQLSSNLQKILAPVDATAVVAVNAGNVLLPSGSMEMTLIEGDLRSIRPFPIQSGKWITPDPDIVLPVAVNEAASVNLGLTTGTVFSTRIGQTGERVIIRVVGVVADGTRDPHAYAPLDLRLSWVKQIAYRMVAPNILLHTDKAADLPALTELIRTEYFRIFDPGVFPGVMRMDQEDAYAETLGAIRLIFSVVAGLSLIVGAMGILNIGLATLRERSDELSLHRSFGATRAQVMAIIVLEGQIVAVSAAIAAVFFGLLSFPHVSAYLTQGLVITALSFPLSAAIIGISACCLAAFAGSLAPAVRAGRVPISSIMRI